LFLKKQASEKHIKYQVLVNSLLRDYMSEALNDDVSGRNMQGWNGVVSHSITFLF